MQDAVHSTKSTLCTSGPMSQLSQAEQGICQAPGWVLDRCGLG